MIRDRVTGRAMTAPVEPRFWAKVEKTETCWFWRGSVTNRGYGSVSVEGRNESSHRVSYQLAFGAIPDGLSVLQSCGHHNCVRPDHLYVGLNRAKLPHPFDPERLWSKVDKSGECWLWTGLKTRYGYGEMSVDDKQQLTHRLAWQITHGPIPPGMFVCHSCDNPPCVRPDHLFIGTAFDNMRDCSAKGRMALQQRPWESPFYRPEVQATINRRGENAGAAKLTVQDVVKIRALAGSRSSTKLGEMFGIGQSQVLRIINRQSWVDVPTAADAVLAVMGKEGAS